MKNMAIVTFAAMGFMAVGALAQRPPGPSQSGPQSSQSGPHSGSTAGSRSSGTREHSGRDSATAPVSFDDADKDKDGKLTRREARRVPHLSFSSADTDDDSALSRQEFQTAMTSAPPRG
ncbi:MAG TPA: EF-hand domain-containing protein [Gammaproteobacteria bacterium]|jgi:hypothetical protein|nr:EF-hand domain-containing protein [Gammaproteobacteria bacterium]